MVPRCLPINYNILGWKIAEVILSRFFPSRNGHSEQIFTVHTETFTHLGVAPFGIAPVVRELILSIELFLQCHLGRF